MEKLDASFQLNFQFYEPNIEKKLMVITLELQYYSFKFLKLIKAILRLPKLIRFLRLNLIKDVLHTLTSLHT